MKRRALLAATGAWLAAAATSSLAQTPRLRRIGFLHPGLEAGIGRGLAIFRSALKELGYVEGKDVALDIRWAEGRLDRLDALAAELVALSPAVILTGTTAGIAACKKATSSIPIVFATAGNPVEQGLVASLNRPGGNVTGITVHMGLGAKIVEIVHEALPKARRLALLVHGEDPAHKLSLEGFEQGARSLNLESTVMRISRAADLERVFKEILQRKTEVLVTTNLALITSLHTELAERARNARLPLVGTNPNIAVAGGLLGYGTQTDENWRRAAAMVDKILRGARPAEMPVEQPERFELVVNIKAAKAIGVRFSPQFLTRANRVIE